MSSFSLSQFVTYWISGANNGTGGKTWVAGVKVSARIAPVDEVVFTAEGKEIRASEAVYTRVSLPVGTYVIEGDQALVSEPVNGSKQVIKASSNSTMSDMFRALIV